MKTLSTFIYSGEGQRSMEQAVRTGRQTRQVTQGWCTFSPLEVTEPAVAALLHSHHCCSDNSDNNRKNDPVGVGVAVITISNQHVLTLSTHLVHVPLGQPQNSLCGGTAVHPMQRRVCGVLSYCASKVPNVWVKSDRKRRAWKGGERRGPCSTHRAVRRPGRPPQLQVPPSIKCRHSHHRGPCVCG